MAITSAELVTIWNTLIRPNYPDTAAIDAAIDLVNWTAKLGNDPLAYTIALFIVNIRDKNTYGFTQTLSAAQKKTMYDEVDEMFTGMQSAVNAIQSAVHTAYTALP